MKFKYSLGEKVLFKWTEEGKPTAEMIGTITGITYTLSKSGSSTEYQVNDTIGGVSDSDILGTVTVKRTPAPRVRKKKNKETGNGSWSDAKTDAPQEHGPDLT